MFGLELRVMRPQSIFHKIEGLQFFVCRVRRVVVSVVSIGDQPREQPLVDTELIFLPYYNRPSDRQQANMWGGFLTTTSRRNMPLQGRRATTVPHIHKTFVGENYTLFRKFRVSQWPSIREEVTADISDAFGTFSDYLLRGATSIGS